MPLSSNESQIALQIMASFDMNCRWDKYRMSHLINTVIIILVLINFSTSSRFLACSSNKPSPGRGPFYYKSKHFNLIY